MKIMWLCVLSVFGNLLGGLGRQTRSTNKGALARLANTSERALNLVGLANRFESGSADDWVQLAPYGDFPHAKGLQRVDRTAAETMANHFNRISSKLSRLFAGVPFYVGHPDVPGMANEYTDRKAYGWVKGLEVRDDGLYGKVEWSEPGKQLLANSHYKFLSPHWNGEPVSTEKGRKVYRPIELVSVGLTNNPNLPVNPLANETESANQPNTIMEKAILIALLGMANEASDEQIKTKITGLVQNQNESATAKTALTNEQTAHSTTKGNLTSLENQFKAERTARIGLMVDNAIREGRVPTANRAQWIADLEKDFDGKSVALANEKKADAKTESRTRDQGNRRESFANVENRTKKVQALVNAKMKTGLNYDAAWEAVKEENAALFNEMEQPEAETK
jgi:phage I-like protein